MKEDELLLQIRQGNDLAFKDLLDNYRSMIFKIINSQNKNYGDFLIDEDELFQEATIALYNSCLKYEADKGMKFSSFAYLCIRSRVINYARHFSHLVNEMMFSLDYESFKYQSVDMVANKPFQYYSSQLEKEEFAKFVEKLSDVDKRIVKLRCENNSYKEIAEKLNISTKRVDNRLMRIKRKMKEYLKV